MTNLYAPDREYLDACQTCRQEKRRRKKRNRKAQVKRAHRRGDQGGRLKVKP